MPAPGFIDHMYIVTDPITGTLGGGGDGPRSPGNLIYSGTIVGPEIGTLLGGLFYHTNKLSQLDGLSVLQFRGYYGGGTITGNAEFDVVGYGRGLGTLVGTIGTIVADSNDFILDGTDDLKESELPEGAEIVGTILLYEQGV